jgi:hypothetical protein
MMSVAAVALIAGAGFANAQGTGAKEQPSAGSTAQQSAPSSERGNSAAQNSPSSGMKATDEKKAEEKSAPGAAKSQRAEEKDKMQSPKSKSSENESKGTKDMKAEGREGKDMKAEGREGKDMKAEGRDTKMNAEQKGAADSKSTTTQSQTTGQAGAGAKLSTEQRTRITSVIRDQHVQPLNNVNFSIAVGTRVPRDVRFYPLPREVVTIYPEWRGYEFVLVNSQIIVIDPRTFEIVAILEA